MGDWGAGLARAYSGLNQSFQTMGAAYAYADMFWLFSVAMLISLPLVLCLRPLPANAEIVALPVSLLCRVRSLSPHYRPR